MFEPINESCNCEHHQLVEIDGEILLAMSVLVNKGYKTNFSCAGHFNQGYNSAYVYFKEKLPDELLPKSKWFEIDDDREDSTTLRGLNRLHDNHYKQKEYTATMEELIILQEDINMFRLELLKWAFSLPDKINKR